MTTLTDRVPTPAEPDAVYEAFVDWAYEQQGLSLYPAQDEALLEIATGSHVVLSTPTGSGKSLVATGAHFAALAAGRNLCATGEMTSAPGWRRAVFSYNHLDTYVDDVAAAANAYAARAAG